MLAIAPGKILFTGAYAVLEGAPAIVMAVNRYAYAQSTFEDLPNVRSEVAAVASLLHRKAPRVDVSELEHHGKKLGLGSSAAAVVAATGILLNESGLFTHSPRPLGEGPGVRAISDSIFQFAYQAHMHVQPRGSGVDVAAATYGKTHCITRVNSQLEIQPIQIPQALIWQVFAVHRPTRTSDVLDRLSASRSQANVSTALRLMHNAAFLGKHACVKNEVQSFLQAAQEHVSGLSQLGQALGLELIPQEIIRIQNTLDSTEVVLLPSGAGGGDLVLWLSTRAPNDGEILRFKQEGLNWIPLAESTLGIHWRHE